MNGCRDTSVIQEALNMRHVWWGFLTVGLCMGGGGFSGVCAAEIPSDAAALYAKLSPRLPATARTWTGEEARRLARAPRTEAFDERRLQGAIRSQPFLKSGQSRVVPDADAEAIAFIVLMQAAREMDKDLKVLMAEAKAKAAAKQKLQGLLEKVNQDVAVHAGKRDSESCHPPHCGASREAHAEASGVLRAARVPSEPLTREVRTVRDLRVVQGELKGKLDSMNEMGEMTSLRLQMMMDRRSKLISTLSNIMKKISTTQDTLIQNLK